MAPQTFVGLSAAPLLLWLLGLVRPRIVVVCWVALAAAAVFLSASPASAQGDPETTTTTEATTTTSTTTTAPPAPPASGLSLLDCIQAGQNFAGAPGVEPLSPEKQADIGPLLVGPLPSIDAPSRDCSVVGGMGLLSGVMLAWKAEAHADSLAVVSSVEENTAAVEALGSSSSSPSPAVPAEVQAVAVLLGVGSLGLIAGRLIP